MTCGPVLLAGGAGKLVYVGACLALVGSGRGSMVLVASGVLDVIFAGCFFYVLWPECPGPPAGR